MRFTSTALLLALPVLGAFAQLAQPQANLARSGGEFAVRQLLSPVQQLAVHGQRECAHGCASPRLHPDASLPPQSQCASDNCNRNRCADKQALQSYCYKAQNCASNFCRNNRCVAAPGEATNGIGCNASVQCSSGYCQNRVCADKAADGSRCYKPQGCSSGFCINRRCAAKDNAPDGTTCTQSIQCDSGYCRRGRCDVKKPVGHVCYKSVGCETSHCRNKRCTLY
jgi:hypothetical protein